MSGKFTGFALPLLVVLALLSPGSATAGPPAGTAGAIARNGLAKDASGCESATVCRTSIVRRGGEPEQEHHDPFPGRHLFERGAEKFRDEDYAAADAAFGRLITDYPHSPLAPLALLGAVVAKTVQAEAMGSHLQRIRLGLESRRLIQKAQRHYPDLFSSHKDFFARHMVEIVQFEAEAAYALAEWLEEHRYDLLAYACYQYVRAEHPMCYESEKAKERQEHLIGGY